MNLVFITTYVRESFLGGAEVLTSLVATEFARIGINVTVFSGGRRNRWVENGVTMITVPQLLPVSFRTIMSGMRGLSLWNVLSEYPELRQADILHAVDVDTATMLSGWKSVRGKLVVSVQEYGLVCPSSDLLYGCTACPNYCHSGKGFACLQVRGLTGGGKARLAVTYALRKQIRDAALHRLRYAICVSRYVQRQLQLCAPHMTTRVIGNAVPDDWLKEHHTHRNIDVLYVGRLNELKGVDVLLQAVNQLNKPHLRILMIGDGNQEKYRTLVRRLGLQSSVRFLGTVRFPEMFEYYRRARIVVVPSVWPEPCGRTIIEGMAAGCVVVATDTGGTPESIADGKNGFLVAPGNPSQLATKLESVLSSPSLVQLRIRAQLHARQNFGVKRIARQYRSFYNLIIPNASRI